MANKRHPIGFFSHYAREDSKLSLSRQMHQKYGFDIWDIPGVKGLYVGDGRLVVAAAEEHPAQQEFIPTELTRPDYKGVPVEVDIQGYSFHLLGHLDHPDDASDDAFYFGYQGRRGGGGGTVQGGSQIVCGQEYGTCGGVFVDSSNKQYLTCSWHVVKSCHGSVSIGSGNRDAPEAAGNVASVGKNGCSCGGGAAPANAQVVDGSKHWAEVGTYGMGATANFDYAIAYPAIFGRSIDSIPYIGRRPLDHNYFQRGGGSGGRRGGGGGGRGGTFWLDDTSNPLTGKGNESILGLGQPKGLRRAVMNEKLSYRGVRSATTKTFPVTGLNYTDRGGICGTCTDMVVMYPCPLPGDSGASYWGSDGQLVAIVTDGSNDKGGNGCTSYNCSLVHLPECFGINVRGAAAPQTTSAPIIKPSAITAQQKRLQEQQQQQSYFGTTIAVA